MRYNDDDNEDGGRRVRPSRKWGKSILEIFFLHSISHLNRIVPFSRVDELHKSSDFQLFLFSVWFRDSDSAPCAPFFIIARNLLLIYSNEKYNFYMRTENCLIFLYAASLSSHSFSFLILPTLSLCFCFMKKHNSFILLCTSLFWPPALIAFLALSCHAIVVVRLFLRQFITSQPERGTYIHAVIQCQSAPPHCPKSQPTFGCALMLMSLLANSGIAESKNMIFDVFFFWSSAIAIPLELLLFTRKSKNHIWCIYSPSDENGGGGEVQSAAPSSYSHQKWLARSLSIMLSQSSNIIYKILKIFPLRSLLSSSEIH